jgi:hypothetical protein
VLRLKESLWIVALTLSLTIACSRGDGDNNKPGADMSSTQDMSSTTPVEDMNAPKDMPVDANMTPEGDMGEVGEDMTPPVDMKPERCAEAEPCKQGYFYDGDCECKISFDRECETDADCREGEVCKQFAREGSDKMDLVCWLDPASLTVVACPGGPGCANSDGELLAAARSMVITPDGFETPKPGGLDEDGVTMSFNPPVRNDNQWNDCGYDGLCPGDEGYTAPDEGEGDKELQGMFIAGFSSGRPAQYCPEELIGCDGPECCVSKLAHDDLKVQIAVLRKGEVTVAFAVIDTIGYFHTYIDEIRERVEQESEVDLLIMSSTHSHEGPDTVGQWGPGNPAPMRPGRDPYFMKKIQDQTVLGIKEAVASLEPAKAEVAVLDTGIDGLAMSDSRPPYIFDDNVPVVYLTNKDTGAPIATMLSVANHAEVLWSGNVFLTADYFHFARKYIREGLPWTEVGGDVDPKPALEGMGGVTVMFAGAVGGLINPGSADAKDYAGRVFDSHGFAKADAVGQRIAMHVLEAKRDGVLQQIEVDQLSFATKRFLTPISNPIFLLAGFILEVFERDIYNATNISGTNFTPTPPMVMSQVAVVRLGPLTFFTAPGELFPESLVGGYPGRTSTQSPVIGDIEGTKSTITCGPDGLPLPENNGTYPCIVKFGQENPPDFTKAPEGPYGYDLVPGEYPFFIGLGMDFLGYMVPEYDYEPDNAPGSHYEETNGASGELIGDWRTNLLEAVDALD